MTLSKKITIFMVLFVACPLIIPAFAFAASIQLKWLPNSEPDMSGYNLYYGTSSRNYNAPIPIGNVTSYTVGGLAEGVKYYFALTALDTSGNESGFSAELSVIATIPQSNDTIPLPTSGEFGRISGGDKSHTNEATFSFEGMPGDAVLSYKVWDVDWESEVRILLNGQSIGFAITSPNQGWSNQTQITLPDTLVNNNSANILKFDNTANPTNSYGWGVGNVSVTQAKNSSQPIPLPANSNYGNMAFGDQQHIDEVIYSFGGRSGNVALRYRVYDIDWNQEVQISVNGTHIGYAGKTGNWQWGSRTIILPDGLVNNNSTNTVRFNNTANPPNNYAWGVGNVSVSSASTAIPLPSSSNYGNMSFGDQQHVGEVIYSFNGRSGDLSLSYQVYDIDWDEEVLIQVNGVFIDYVGATGNGKWSNLRTIIIPDYLVNNQTSNIVRFNNTGNPPNSYSWGVGKVSIY